MVCTPQSAVCICVLKVRLHLVEGLGKGPYVPPMVGTVVLILGYNTAIGLNKYGLKAGR